MVWRRMRRRSRECRDGCPVPGSRSSLSGDPPSLARSFSDSDTPVDYFGEQLLASGYNYYGNEPMYSGITGEEFQADIYLGVVYYQRLRHMVNDKFQVRTTGPVDPLTRQPIKVGQALLNLAGDD